VLRDRKPALGALTVDMVPTGQLNKANALLGLTQAASGTAGSGSCGRAGGVGPDPSW